MPKKGKAKPHFRSKEAKRKYEAYKHMHVPGCKGKGKGRKK